MTPEKAAIRRATGQAQQAVTRLDAAGLAALARAYQNAAADIRRQIEAAAGAEGSVTLEALRGLLVEVEGRLARVARVRDDLLAEGLEKAAQYGARVWDVGASAAPAAVPGAAVQAQVLSPAAMAVSETAVRLVNEFVAADGLQLSDRLWRIDRGAREAVTQAIERAVIEGHSAAQAARAFLARGEAVPAAIAEKMRGPAGGTIGREAAGMLTGNGGAMDNAMRVFRTEINRAHGEAYMAGGEGKPYFGGWRYLLSPAHPEPDICDLLAAQNLHGLGRGVYPSRAKCPWPAHPNTLSFVEIVFKDEIGEAERAGRETPLQALARLSPETRRGVLGKTRGELFDAGLLTQGMIRAPVAAVKKRVGAANV